MKPSSRCPTVREKRFAVSLAFLHALRAYKGKVEAFLKKSFTKKLYSRFARPPLHACTKAWKILPLRGSL